MIFEIIVSLIILVFSFILIKRSFKYPKEIISHIKKPTDPIDKLKQFKLIEISKPSESNITVLSYNILTQKYMKRKEIKSLCIENRIKKIIIEITSLNPDIFCLQESTYEVYKKYLKPSLSSTYHIITFDNYDSYLMNVIGIKRTRFNVIKEYNFDIKSINIDVKGNRGVMGVELEDVLIQGKKLFVINVHFPWKPIYEYEKAKIMQFIFDFILQRNDEHIIIAGDFNSLVNSVVVRMIYYEEWYNELNRNMKYIGNFIFNKKETELMDNMRFKMKKKENFKRRVEALLSSSKKIYEKYQFKSAYDDYLLYSNPKNDINNHMNYYYMRYHPNFTNYTSTFKETIDYIFYSNSLRKIKIGSFPSEDEINSFLPDEVYPSDHLKLFAQFAYK